MTSLAVIPTSKYSPALKAAQPDKLALKSTIEGIQSIHNSAGCPLRVVAQEKVSFLQILTGQYDLNFSGQNLIKRLWNAITGCSSNNIIVTYCNRAGKEYRVLRNETDLIKKECLPASNTTHDKEEAGAQNRYREELQKAMERALYAEIEIKGGTTPTKITEIIKQANDALSAAVKFCQQSNLLKIDKNMKIDDTPFFEKMGVPHSKIAEIEAAKEKAARLLEQVKNAINLGLVGDEESEAIQKANEALAKLSDLRKGAGLITGARYQQSRMENDEIYDILLRASVAIQKLEQITENSIVF